MRARTPLTLLLALALAAAVVPAATADHIDDEGDSFTVDYVHALSGTGIPSVDELCTDARTGVGEVGLSGDPLLDGHVLSPVVVEGACTSVPHDSSYSLTVEGEDGTPAPFSWEVFHDYGHCSTEGQAVGSATITISDDASCSSLRVYVDDGAPVRGTITVERLG